jgi:23S rRNA (uracil1939-C5)-methyltransferase
MLNRGDRIELTIEKPVPGGRMIARHEGQVVLVAGAIPGERVEAAVDRVERRLAFATAVRVLEPSADRRAGHADPLCGGCLYSHIEYARQIRIKAEVIADAFARIGRMPLPEPVPVSPSPERGYRMRARLHVHDGRAGFYREGTHALCDPSLTGQLLEAALAAASHVLDTLSRAGVSLTSIEIAENLAADQRAVHAEAVEETSAGPSGLIGALEAVPGGLVTGISVRTSRGLTLSAGDDSIADPLDQLTHGRSAGVLRRRAASFFQANRFLLPELVTSVMDAVSPAGEVVDLYAGAGLFSLALAGAGRGGITAVEGDASSGGDLERNAAAVQGRVRAHVEPVEAWLQRHGSAAGTVILDPPRTGLSSGAAESLTRTRASRLIYVSCDAATMARDARKLVDARYRLTTLRAFDLFPNTPHVEVLGVFDR